MRDHDPSADRTPSEGRSIDAASPRSWSLGIASILIGSFMAFAILAILAPDVMAYPVGPGPLTVTVYAGTALIVLCVVSCFLYAFGIDDRVEDRRSEDRS